MEKSQNFSVAYPGITWKDGKAPNGGVGCGLTLTSVEMDREMAFLAGKGYF
ncbi:hypothetical protein [Gracilibacillus ureilyticus]|uniref:hypothetical protein n=1 Tax=Gracilibacillus ureilyticus TaxID=531814 RepID=UPI0015879B80|nr:hypothetical protein [Gracilibacillus ureilyticus]